MMTISMQILCVLLREESTKQELSFIHFRTTEEVKNTFTKYHAP